MKACETCAKRYDDNGYIIGACPEFVADYQYYVNTEGHIEPPCWVERKNKFFFVVWDGNGNKSEWTLVEAATLREAETRARRIATDMANNNPGHTYILLQAKAKYTSSQVEVVELK